MPGFWDAHGARAVVDWCEPNYVVSPYIAEFWNTLSSVAIFLVGAYGVWRWARSRGDLEPRFGAGFLWLAAVGLGSTLFHGTLLRLPQAADELPMIWLSLVCFYCLVTRRPDTPEATRQRWVAGLTAYALVFSVAYFAIKAYFVFFLLSYGLVVGYVCIATWRLAFRESRHPMLKRLFWWSVVAYIGGFSLFWIPERTLGCAHAFQSIQPHAWFHLSGAIGPYAWVLFAAFDRLERLQRSPVVVRDPIPFVAPG